MRLGRRNTGRELFDASFPEVVKVAGLAAAEAQFELERVGIRLARMMTGRCETEAFGPHLAEPECGTDQGYVTFNGRELSLHDLGFSPSF